MTRTKILMRDNDHENVKVCNILITKMNNRENIKKKCSRNIEMYKEK